MKKCRNCGMECSDFAEYCGNCGEKFAFVNANTGEERTRKKKKFLILFYCITIAIFAVLVLYLWQLWERNRDSEENYNSSEYAKTLENKTAGHTIECGFNESFELCGATIKFTDAFSNPKHEFWESTDDSNILAGYDGYIQNNSDTGIDLNDFEYELYFINGCGKKQRSTTPKVAVWAPESLSDLLKTTTYIAPGQSGDLYILASPDKDCEILSLTITVPDDMDQEAGSKVIITNPYYSYGSYENSENTSFVRCAWGYSDDLACIKYYSNEIEYYGYLDKEGSLKFSFPSKDSNDFCSKPSDFDNGYITYFYGLHMYVIDNNGNITSKYYAGNVIAYGSGYTWVEAEHSGFEDRSWDYFLYNPDGDLEGKFEKMDHKIDISYLGDGIFTYSDYDNNGEKQRVFYFTKSHKWVQADFYKELDNMIIQDGWIYNCCTVDDTCKYFDMYDNEGNHNEFALPESMYDYDMDVFDVTEKYVLFTAENDDTMLIYIYDVTSGDVRLYSGSYMECIDDDISFADDRNQWMTLMENSILVWMEGADKESYIGFIDAESMEEICDPVRADQADVYDEALYTSIYHSEDNIYDTTGTLLSSFGADDYAGKIGGLSNGAMVTACDYEGYENEVNLYTHNYLTYSGDLLFSEINYDTGKDIKLDE